MFRWRRIGAGEIALAPEERAEGEVGVDRLRRPEPRRVGQRLDGGVRIARDDRADALQVRLRLVAPAPAIDAEDRHDGGERPDGEGDPGGGHGDGGEPGVEPRPRLVERLDDDALVGQHRHEVVVAGPARDDVPVEVVGDPRARGAAEVHPDVHPVRRVHRLHHRDGAPQLLAEIGVRLGGERPEVGEVRPRDHHHVAGVVGVPVEAGERVRRAVDDEVLAVVRRRAPPGTRRRCTPSASRRG